MMTGRLEVRLGPEHRKMLSKITETRGTPVSEVVRSLIERAYEEIGREERRRAVERIASANVEHVPDPDELSRQLDQTYDLPNLY